MDVEMWWQVLLIPHAYILYKHTPLGQGIHNLSTLKKDTAYHGTVIGGVYHIFLSLGFNALYCQAVLSCLRGTKVPSLAVAPKTTSVTGAV